MAPLIAVVVAAVAIGFVMIRARNRTRERDSALNLTPTAPVFRAAVQAKVRLDPGGWSRKTMGGMRVLIASDVIEVVLVFRRLGRLLGSDYVLPVATVRARRTRLRSDPLRREWIVLSGHDGGRAVSLAIRSKQDGASIVTALERQGVQVSVGDDEGSA